MHRAMLMHAMANPPRALGASFTPVSYESPTIPPAHDSSQDTMRPSSLVSPGIPANPLKAPEAPQGMMTPSVSPPADLVTPPIRSLESSPPATDEATAVPIESPATHVSMVRNSTVDSLTDLADIVEVGDLTSSSRNPSYGDLAMASRTNSYRDLTSFSGNGSRCFDLSDFGHHQFHS